MLNPSWRFLWWIQNMAQMGFCFVAQNVAYLLIYKSKWYDLKGNRKSNYSALTWYQIHMYTFRTKIISRKKFCLYHFFSSIQTVLLGSWRKDYHNLIRTQVILFLLLFSTTDKSQTIMEIGKWHHIYTSFLCQHWQNLKKHHKLGWIWTDFQLFINIFIMINWNWILDLIWGWVSTMYEQHIYNYICVSFLLLTVQDSKPHSKT